MRKHIVFLDLDGTLLLRDGTMPDSAREALNRARKKGHEMVICTGRSTTQIEPVLGPDFDLFDGVVSSAGANVRRGDDVVWRGSLEPERVHTLVAFFRQHDITYFLQAESGIYAEESSMEDFRQIFTELGRTPEEIDEIFGSTTVTDHPENTDFIEKCCYFRCPLPAAEVQDALGDYYQVVDSSYKVSRFCDGEVVKAGCNKATGMEKYLEAAGMDHEACIAFGDGPNDLEMLEYAHIGVCMGNGTDQTKAVADMVCGNIDEDGLYNAFRELNLI